ncbi:MAG: TolC family protein [Kofleriaceae bacterium]|nr:TolC family protein [Kofleriaceae bacterium]
MLNVFRLYKRAALFAALSATISCSSDTQIGSTLPKSLSGQTDWTTSKAAPTSELTAPSGTLAQYLAFALSNSPETRAAFETWRSVRLRRSSASRLPEPVISFGYYLRSVETKVGPQLYKIGVSQAFPWPGKLESAENAVAEKAKAAALMVDAKVLDVKRNVAMAYWDLWLIGEQHKLKTEHDAILEALAGAVRGRLQVGTATLADLNQIDLKIARHHDHREQHKEAAIKASAILRSVIGSSRADVNLPATDLPPFGVPKASASQLIAMSRKHPMIQKFSHLASSEEHRAQAKRADRYPRFKVGINLIGTGEASNAVEDSGKDALVISAGLSLPLWGSSYGDAAESAIAASLSHEATLEAGIRQSEAMLESALSDVRDAQRKIELYDKTLIPQAESTFEAVLGGYQIGRSTVAAVIIAQRDLIELRLDRALARARRAKSWATLEFVVGQELDTGAP